MFQAGVGGIPFGEVDLGDVVVFGGKVRRGVYQYAGFLRRVGVIGAISEKYNLFRASIGKTFGYKRADCNCAIFIQIVLF